MIGIRPISTYLINHQSRQFVSSTQKQVQEAGTELATGLLANSYKTLGLSSSQGISLRNALSQNEEMTVQNNLVESKLDLTADALVNVRDAAEETLNLAVQNMKDPNATVEAIDIEAKSSIQGVIQALNINLSGENLFSGINSERTPLTPMNDEINGTGMDSLELIESVIGPLPNDAAEVDDIIARIDDFFESNNADPNNNYEGTIYNGTPLEDGSGNPNPRLTARIDTDETLNFGIQANDEGARTVMKGLYMMAAVDVAEIDDKEAFTAYMDYATKELSRGVDLVREAEAKLGTEQALLEKVQVRQENQRVLLNNRIVDVEHVDPYDAQVRLNMLETQLQATYNVSARMGQMSFSNWMR